MKQTYEELEEQLNEAIRKNELYANALKTLKNRHFPNVKSPDFKESTTDGRLIPGTLNSAWQDSREAFALLDEAYMNAKLGKKREKKTK